MDGKIELIAKSLFDVLIAVAFVFGLFIQVEAVEVTFKDPNLEVIVREVLNILTGPITSERMAELIRLDAPWRGIQNLSGLEYAVNLQELNLELNQITDISPLSGLTNLQVLNLGVNQITNISPLSRLINLKELYLNGNQITDISPLSGLTNLQVLNLGVNQITDISPLSRLINLKELYLNGNQITDISPLSGLTNLQVLDLGINQITNISPLSRLTNLKELYLNGNQITDISPLSGLINLQWLILMENRVTDISSLSRLINLMYLYLEGNQIADISPLSGLINLQWLSLQENRITDISPLVANPGLGSEDLICLEYNYLDLTPGSKAMQDIQTLISRGASVSYKPQTVEVVFKDPNLEAAVREALGIPIGPITSGKMAELRSLSAYKRSIQNLSGLEYAVNLQELHLEGNQIADISPLSGLINLQWLSLQENRITDISPLSRLINLMYLYLEGNQIADISPLSGLINLQVLILMENRITDISPLSRLTNLEWLNLEGNQIADISPLSGLINLQGLYLGGNQITDISPLSGLTNLEWLNLDGNRITDISPLSGLTNLQLLSLWRNRITNISSLSRLIKLQVLSLSGNQITDISPLSGLTNLQRLYLGGNRITDISPLSGLTNLQELYLELNRITDISPLSGLTNLQVLDLGVNQITDISPLSRLINLKELYLNGNQITDISPLVANTGLGSGDKIDLTHNYLDLTPGSKAMKDIQTLISRGVGVDYLPQREGQPTNQPPVASFTFTPVSPKAGEEVAFDASASYDPDGSIASYSWDFGDGATAEGKVVKHAFAKDGTYNVTLTVTDDKGLSGTASGSIVVSKAAKPQITGVEPAQPQALSDRQWLTIRGEGFASDCRVTLETDGTEYPIPRDRIDYVDNATIKVFVDLATPGRWRVWVTNPDGQESNKFEFNVRSTAAVQLLLSLGLDKTNYDAAASTGSPPTIQASVGEKIFVAIKYSGAQNWSLGSVTVKIPRDGLRFTTIDGKEYVEPTVKSGFSFFPLIWKKGEAEATIDTADSVMIEFYTFGTPISGSGAIAILRIELLKEGSYDVELIPTPGGFMADTTDIPAPPPSKATIATAPPDVEPPVLKLTISPKAVRPGGDVVITVESSEALKADPSLVIKDARGVVITVPAPTKVGNTYTYSIKVPETAAVGNASVSVEALDLAGNKGMASGKFSVVVAPILSVVAVRTTPAASVPKAGYVWKVGQKVQMKVWAEGLVDINAAGFALKYDPAMLKIVDVVGGKRFGEPIYTDDPVAGILDVSVAVLGEGMSVTGNTTLAAITFEVQTEAVGQTDLVLQTATAFDIYGNEIAANKVNGAIRIIKLLGDFNGDGAVNIADLAILKKYYGKAVGATLPDGTKVPADQVKGGMKVDDPPAGDGIWKIDELRMLATQWGWDWKVLRAPDVGTVDAEGRFLSSVFREIGLKADRSRIGVGDTVNVELWVDAAGMTAGRVVLKYDPSKLQFVGSVAGEMPFVYVSPGSGTITVEFAPMGGAVGKVASFTFKAIGAGYPGLKVDSSVMWDIAGNEISGPVAEADLVIGSAELAGKEEKDVGKLELRALYPNPASDYVVVPIVSPKGSIARVAVATVSGQVLKKEVFEIKAGVNQVVIDLSGIAPGAYRIIVKADGKVLVRNLAVR